MHLLGTQVEHIAGTQIERPPVVFEGDAPFDALHDDLAASPVRRDFLAYTDHDSRAVRRRMRAAEIPTPARARRASDVGSGTTETLNEPLK